MTPLDGPAPWLDTSVVSLLDDPASPVVRVAPLGFPYETRDPFLFCVHHLDVYPPGNDELGPNVSLRGRALGQDFTLKDGLRMYHGKRVPGFPQHPHRGFETVTIVRAGIVDHSDSLGAAGRYAAGDVQWLTAGSGIQHAEMFPLLDKSGSNTTELFQIWLNLRARNKLVKPHFKMFWRDLVPELRVVDESGRSTWVKLVAGTYALTTPPAPPPDSWAAEPDSDVAIWTLRLEPGATFSLPPAQPKSKRTLYFFAGSSLNVGGRAIPPSHLVEVRPSVRLQLSAGDDVAQVLMLQGKPIGEPVVQHGPFVMTSREDIIQTFHDYEATQFGGWPWPRHDPVHGSDQGRFARKADGQRETPP